MMNKDILKSFIVSYKRDSEKEYKAEYRRIDLLAESVRKYSKDDLLSLTPDTLLNYLASLWSMAMWGNKQYQVDYIIETNGLDLLRAQFTNLIYGSDKLEKRWDEFRGKVKGVGTATMSELLGKVYPDKYIIWTSKSYAGLKLLDIEELPRYSSNLSGKNYLKLCEIGNKLLLNVSSQLPMIDNLLKLNSFIWELSHLAPSSHTEVQVNPKEAKFLHNEIRDKIADIGNWLGFKPEVEKRVAQGAIVDAVWEVTIGNMGRVIYVFEVQTSGSIDSLILNLMRAKNNKAVQGIVAVTDQEQMKRIEGEISTLPIKDEIKFWDYREVLQVYEQLQSVNESINKLGLVPSGL